MDGECQSHMAAMILFPSILRMGKKMDSKRYLDSHQLAMLLRVPNCQITMLTSYRVQVLLFV